VSDIEVIKPGEINETHERMLKADVRYHFAIDNASLNKINLHINIKWA
jgi:D-arabinose 1-dehydrogenase-like Zn-dependent alcohol dehydrogenase